MIVIICFYVAGDHGDMLGDQYHLEKTYPYVVQPIFLLCCEMAVVC